MNDEIRELKQEDDGKYGNVIKNGIPAVVLILIGVGLLAGNFLSIPFDNWWALFLIAPVLFLSYQVWRDYKSNGRFTGRSIAPLIGSLVLVFMLATFLFELDMSQLWPVFFIVGGIAALLGKRAAG